MEGSNRRRGELVHRLVLAQLASEPRPEPLRGDRSAARAEQLKPPNHNKVKQKRQRKARRRNRS